MLDTDLRHQILDSMSTLLPRVLRRDIPAPTADTRLMEDLGMTSSTTLELLLELEEDLEIQVNVEDISEGDVVNLGTLADFIATHLMPEQ